MGTLFTLAKEKVAERRSQDKKIVVVVRKDVGLPPGLMTEYCIHAALKSFQVIFQEAEANPLWESWVSDWRDGWEKSIVLQARNVGELREVRHAAIDGNRDPSLPVGEFVLENDDGSPICFAIGPAPASNIDAVTRNRLKAFPEKLRIRGFRFGDVEEEEEGGEEEALVPVDCRGQERRGRCQMNIFIRTDLGMSPGKIAAISIHAAFRSVCRLQKLKKGNGVRWLDGWMQNPETVVLAVPGPRELMRVKAQATRTGKLPVILYRDWGKTEVPWMSPICVAIGPAPSNKKIVGRVTVADFCHQFPRLDNTSSSVLVMRSDCWRTMSVRSMAMNGIHAALGCFQAVDSGSSPDWKRLSRCFANSTVVEVPNSRILEQAHHEAMGLCNLPVGPLARREEEEEGEEEDSMCFAVGPVSARQMLRFSTRFNGSIPSKSRIPMVVSVKSMHAIDDQLAEVIVIPKSREPQGIQRGRPMMVVFIWSKGDPQRVSLLAVANAAFSCVCRIQSLKFRIEDESYASTERREEDEVGQDWLRWLPAWVSSNLIVVQQVSSRDKLMRAYGRVSDGGQVPVGQLCDVGKSACFVVGPAPTNETIDGTVALDEYVRSVNRDEVDEIEEGEGEGGALKNEDVD